MDRLTSSFSVAASITRSAVPKAEKSVAVWICTNAASLASDEMTERLTWRSMLRAMVARALVSASCLTSTTVTERPASAHTCAMPLPI